MVARNLVLNLTVKIMLIILQHKHCYGFAPGFNHVLILRTNIKTECHLENYTILSPKVNSGGTVRRGKESMDILVTGWAVSMFPGTQ